MSCRFSLLNFICRFFWLKKDDKVSLPSDQEILDEARNEIVYAYNILSNIDDPDMLDWAIFNLRAAEEKYNFILRRIKRNTYES
ncbi:DUF2508 family protein [Thermosyntropha sp.]|uniref:DUF2508 family protein n=1 Tax=Thermosyntropha sp. TaxID=2740820 RepID=UPI0025F0E0F0|nr:DUF2508 family protein [Thermosyntropha sp.]MBO8159980.1 DUF2508 family protein [Thermosyntropha sp.]